MNVTYYVVQGFETGKGGALKHLPPQQCQSAHAALRRAESLSKKGGAIAFSRTGDPSCGDFEDAVVLGRFGLTPAELE